MQLYVSAYFLVGDKLLVQTCPSRSMVVCIRDIVDGDGLGSVFGTNPVGIREVDSYCLCLSPRE